jgi:hypothetical protein
VKPVPEGTTASGGLRARQRSEGLGLLHGLPRPRGPAGLALAGAALILGAELLVGQRRRGRTRF